MDASEKREEYIEKVGLAAGFNCQYAIPNLVQLLGYRQRVAQDLLRAKEPENKMNLETELNYVNSNIRLLLGI